ncbi:MAG: hypothetical protein AAF228_12805 [Pseudomonadota bacterium]
MWINAEELGITSTNVDLFFNESQKRNIIKFLGREENIGAGLGLDSYWAYRVIKAVGNYEEMYTRHLEPLGIRRAGTVNALWTQGGVLYAPPMLPNKGFIVSFCGLKPPLSSGKKISN